jgi:ABC-type amino acid transport substrate-binding protein
MQRINHIYLFLVLVFASLYPTNSNANRLILATDDGPPHMIKAIDGGIDIDIVKQVLNQIGHDVDTIYVPLERAKLMVSDHKADVFVPTFFQPDNNNIYYSDPVISYKPMVFSLKSNKILYKSISDLKKLSVITFQGASGYFGKEFAKLLEKSDYKELHDMSKLPELLLKERYEVVVLDYYIFYYFLKQQLEKNSVKFTYQEIVSFPLIPEVNAYAGFNDKVLRDKFNQQLSIFKQAKNDQRIVENYIGSVDSFTKNK